jgi:hypothetical protein
MGKSLTARVAGPAVSAGSAADASQRIVAAMRTAKLVAWTDILQPLLAAHIPAIEGSIRAIAALPGDGPVAELFQIGHEGAKPARLDRSSSLAILSRQP